VDALRGHAEALADVLDQDGRLGVRAGAHDG
jgi:hypothetical protein